MDLRSKLSMSLALIRGDLRSDTREQEARCGVHGGLQPRNTQLVGAAADDLRTHGRQGIERSCSRISRWR